jgi:hypothetical protein
VGQHGSASGPILLGLDGFEVTAAEIIDGGWQLEVQTTATVVGCVGCGVRAEAHGRRAVRVRDLPIGGRPVVQCWRKRIWRCREPACSVRTWTERTAAICLRAVLTERARAEACRRVGKDALAVAAVARDLGVGWATVMQAVAEHGTRLVDDAARLEGVAALGLDETTFLKATRGRAHPVGHRPGGPRGRSAIGPGGRAHQGRGGRLAPCPTAGLALVAGFFNADQGDLAVGAPREDVGSAGGAGAVSVFSGTPGGLPTASRVLLQTNPEVGDQFGSALAAGFFDTGASDLAIGAPFEDLGTATDAGAVNVVYGSATGLPGPGGQLFTQDSPGVGGTAEPGDSFGSALD